MTPSLVGGGEGRAHFERCHSDTDWWCKLRNCEHCIVVHFYNRSVVTAGSLVPELESFIETPRISCHRYDRRIAHCHPRLFDIHISILLQIDSYQGGLSHSPCVLALDEMIGQNCSSTRSSCPTVAFDSHLNTIRRRSSFQGAQLRETASKARTTRQQLVIQNFKFLKDLGMKKPAFLPDFGLVCFWNFIT